MNSRQSQITRQWRWLLRPSAFATPRVMAQTTGWTAIAGCVLGSVLVRVMPPVPITAGSYIAIVLAGLLGVAVLRWGERLRRGHFEAVVWFGIALVGFGAHAASSDVGAIAATCDFVLLASLAGFFFTLVRAGFLIGAAALGCLAVLWVRPELPWWTGLCAANVAVLTGGTVLAMGRLASAAEIDSLTGLYNRRGFDRRLEAAVVSASRAGGRPVLVMFDIDHFQSINEQFGHAGGDDALREIARSARRLVDRSDVFARYGGDEFAILSTTATEHDAIALSERIRESMPTGCSAGVTSWQQGESASSLVSRADIALYQAKRSGRNRTRLDSGTWPPLARELREAVLRDAIDVHYQPIVDLGDGRTIGVEALLRWRPASRPEVQPDEVVRIAEDNDLIGLLDERVLVRACHEAGRLRRALGDDLCLNVNVSGLELAEDGYVDTVVHALRRTRWPAEQLVLEVTETVLEADTATAIANLESLRALGIRIAIDDFGSGFSSLSRLAELPTDLLKLDSDFVSAITAESGPPRLLAAVAAIGAALNLPVTAEGVEDAKQATVVTGLGFACAQGYFFGRPQPAAALVAAAEDARQRARSER